MSGATSPLCKHFSHKFLGQGCSGDEETPPKAEGDYAGIECRFRDILPVSDLGNKVEGTLGQDAPKKGKVWVGDEELSFGHADFDMS